MEIAAASRQADFELSADPVPAGAVIGAPATLLRPARESICRLGAEWDDLAAAASEPNAFAELWFFRAGLRHLAGDADVRMLEVRDGIRLIGLLPLAIAPRYGRMPVRHVENWRHFHSFLGAPLVRAGAEQLFWTGALAALDREPWALSFLHLNDLVENGPLHRGLVAAAALAGRSCDVVKRSERALLETTLSPQAYYEATVRKKKRKELKRLQSRLAELGNVATRHLAEATEVEPWCDQFLALERSGWKGKEGSALICSANTEAFFRKAVAGAHEAGRLDFLRLDLDGRPLAMLVNFLTAPGSFSFKIAFDEEYARFSPGVLLQIENLQVLDRPEIAWMDSCAIENHSMINSLWGERRSLVRVTVPLAGAKRRAIFRICRAAEDFYAAAKRRRSPTPLPDQDETDQ